MDTSERYIKMCESAEDIQRFWNFENGDYVFDLLDGETMVWFGYPPEKDIKVVWLPRQDQLQELCINFYTQNLKVSMSEAFIHFLGWHSTCLKKSHDTGFIIGKNVNVKK